MLVENQREIEYMYSKKYIRKYISDEISNDAELQTKMDLCIDLINDWAKQSYYQSKNDRIAQFMASKNIKEVVLDLFILVIPINKPTLFTSVVGEFTARLGISDKVAGATTAAEILAVTCNSDVFDIYKDNKYDSLQIVSNYELDQKVLTFIEQTKYLPPMICPPRIVKSNIDSGYLTHKDSMILGKGNLHSENICLDSINTFNQVALSLNVELLTKLSEKPSKPLTDPAKKEQWLNFVNDSYATYKMLIQMGNQFWLTHKVDKRGRTYAQGYHVTTQGNSFRKAVIEFHEKEIIEGI